MRTAARRAGIVIGLVTAAISAGAACDLIVGIQPLVTGDTSGTGGQGGTGAGGGGSTMSAGGGGSTGAGIVPCEVAFISGTYAADAFQQPSLPKSLGGPAADPWHWYQEYSGPGYLHIIGTEYADPFYFAPDKTYDIAFGLLRLNSDATTHAGELGCITPGSSFSTLPSGLKVASLAVHAVGGCAGGQPVDGVLDLCMGCMPQWTGTLDGVAMPSSETSMGSSLGDPTGDEINIFTTELWMHLSTTDTLQLDATGPIADGIVYTDPSGPFLGAVFCVGSGSTYHWPTGVHLENLTKLGHCPTTTGADTISLCF